MTEITETADFTVIGAGIVGLATAVELQRRHPGARVLVAGAGGPGGRCCNILPGPGSVRSP